MNDSIEELRKDIAFRMKTDPYSYLPEPLWDKMVNNISNNMDETLDFIESICTDEELVYLTEIFDDIVLATQNKKFLDIINKRAEQVKNPKAKKEILQFSKMAETYLLDS